MKPLLEIRGWTRRHSASLFVIALVLIALALLGSASGVPNQPGVRLNAANAGPREVEEQTQKAVLRDYAGAWRAMAQALEQSNPAALGDLWVGYARENLTDAIQEQKSTSISVRYVDQGHQLDALFYSPEGSALQLHDTAQLERQVLDGGNIIASENLTAHYIVVMTPASDRWQVRLLQAVP